jgi:alpha-L-fucosidase
MGADANSGWGYWNHNIYRKTPAQLIHLLVTAVSRGGNILFNVGPDPDGVIPYWQMENLNSIGDWMEDNAEAVYGVKYSNVTVDINGRHGNSSGVCSEKDGILYFYLLEWPGTETIIPIMKRKIISATVLKTGQKLKHRVDANGRLIISGLPSAPIDPYCTVIRMEMDGAL